MLNSARMRSDNDPDKAVRVLFMSALCHIVTNHLCPEFHEVVLQVKYRDKSLGIHKIQIWN